MPRSTRGVLILPETTRDVSTYGTATVTVTRVTSHPWPRSASSLSPTCVTVSTRGGRGPCSLSLSASAMQSIKAQSRACVMHRVPGAMQGGA
eukprot:63565-Rhodomonas_salina.2